MCLSDFVEFKQIEEKDALIGYRTWRLPINNPEFLFSESRDYKWDKMIEGPHEVLDRNSGIYAYNNNNNNNYNYYNNYYNNYNNNYYNNYNYNILGIIKQYGKVAIHKTGQRSEFAKIDTLFNICEANAKGPEDFIKWIKEFNLTIENLSKKYECKIISWQDFKEQNK